MSNAFKNLLAQLGEDRIRFGADLKVAASDDEKARLRRQYAASAVAHVVAFLNDPENVDRCPDIVQWGLDHHLHDLLRALQELEDGRSPALLTVKPAQVTRSFVDGTFKGRAAAMSEMLRRAGEKPAKADDMVAKALTKAGYRVPRNGGQISATTVGNWRKEAREGAATDVVRDTHDRIVEQWAAEGTPPNEIRRAAAGLMTGLTADHPEGTPHRLVMREPVTGKV